MHLGGRTRYGNDVRSESHLRRTALQITYENSATGISMANRSANAALLLFALLAFEAIPARAELFSLAASGTISENSSGDSTIPIGTPWTFELTYNTAVPDRDFELTGSPDPTFGEFTNTATPPALSFFHYKAGAYEVTLDNPADFGTFMAIDITFTSIKGIDINIFAPAFIPLLREGRGASSPPKTNTTAAIAAPLIHPLQAPISAHFLWGSPQTHASTSIAVPLRWKHYNLVCAVFDCVTFENKGE